MTLRRAAVVLLRIALGAVFLYAAASKLGAPDRFAQEIANYRLLPARIVGLAAAALPACEAVIGVALLAGALLADAAAAATLLLGLFTVAIGSTLVRGIDLACGCFGGQELVSGSTLARDLALLAMAVTLLLLARGGRASRSQSPSATHRA